jgi:hypothetical protein
VLLLLRVRGRRAAPTTPAPPAAPTEAATRTLPPKSGG